MREKEIINILSEILDVDSEDITMESSLEEYEDWDSLAKLTLMARVKQLIGLKLSQEDIKKFVTVNDVCNCLGSLQNDRKY